MCFHCFVRHYFVRTGAASCRYLPWDAPLRHRRAGIFLRDIKITMKMDVLRCRMPAMIHKELTMQLTVPIIRSSTVLIRLLPSFRTLLLMLCLFYPSGFAATSPAGAEVTEFRCEFMKTPLGIDDLS